MSKKKEDKIEEKNDEQKINIKGFISNDHKLNSKFNYAAVGFIAWWKSEGFKTIKSEKLTNPMSYVLTESQWKEHFERFIKKEVK